MCLVCSVHTVPVPLPREARWCSCSALAGLSCMQGTCSRQHRGAQDWIFWDAHGTGDTQDCCGWQHRDVCDTGMLRLQQREDHGTGDPVWGIISQDEGWDERL